jgi:hypothetical protein
MIAAFYALLDGLTFDANGSTVDDLNLDQVGRLSAAYRHLVASSATYEHGRVAKAICKAMKPFTLARRSRLAAKTTQRSGSTSLRHAGRVRP